MIDLLYVTFWALASIFLGCAWTGAMIYHAMKCILDESAGKKRRIFDFFMAVIYLFFPMWFVVTRHV